MYHSLHVCYHHTNSASSTTAGYCPKYYDGKYIFQNSHPFSHSPPHWAPGVPSLTLKAPCINPFPTFTCCLQNDVTTVLFCLSLCCQKSMCILPKHYINSLTLNRERAAWTSKFFLVIFKTCLLVFFMKNCIRPCFEDNIP